MYNKAWYHANKERLTLQRRKRHANCAEGLNQRRRERYAENRVHILEMQRTDRAECPLCRLSFRRGYISQHIAKRHQNPTCLTV
jgi:hypothetical protein